MLTTASRSFRSISGARRGPRFLSSTPRFMSPGFFELRTDQVAPESMSDYLEEHEQTAEARQAIFPGWLGIWKTELGGCVHSVRHLYHWNDYDERDHARCVAEDNPIYKGHRTKHMGPALPLPSLRHTLTSSTSVIMLEATSHLQACGLSGAAGFASEAHHGNRPGEHFVEADNNDTAIAWELRTYQLQLGYETVPRFLELYSDGLADKLAADDSGASQLATLLYSDCGSLNVVMELWRHESLQRSQASRAASRKATSWRKAINEIAKLTTSFETQFLRPLASSPWR